MEVKEAIEYLEGIKPNSYEKNARDKIKKILIDRGITTKTNEEFKGIERKYIINIDEVISLLQQGEKYRLMWEELTENYLDHDYCVVITDEQRKELEQKYFPKENGKNE